MSRTYKSEWTTDDMARVRRKYCQNCRKTGGVVWHSWRCEEGMRCESLRRRHRDVYDAVAATGAHWHGRYLCASCRQTVLPFR